MKKVSDEIHGVTVASVRIAWLRGVDVSLPVIRFGSGFDYAVALDKERLHVAREEEPVCDLTKDSER